MKKGLLVLYSLLCVFVFYSCDKDDPDNTNYLNNKLIAGKWYGLYAKDSMVYTFKDNKATCELYAHVSGLSTLKYEGKDNYGNYLLTDSLILLSNPSDFRLIYQLKNNNDSLYIRNPKDNPILWVGLKKLKE
ncbi:MAG: hypothetical protein LBL79_06800 [Prevotella sp.]|jgi:hypothetical protein|nr:hypothetical protein [Prevotella sp.]